MYGMGTAFLYVGGNLQLTEDGQWTRTAVPVTGGPGLSCDYCVLNQQGPHVFVTHVIFSFSP